MLTALQTKKLNHRFKLLDADRDGAIDGKDYDMIVSRLSEVYAAKPGSKEHQLIAGIHAALWKELRQLADADGDGRVTSQEFVKAYAALLERDDAYDRLVKVPAKGLIALADRDGDGKLSLDEYIDAMSGYAVSETDAAEAFEHLDRNSDGYLTEAELLQNIEEFYLGDDANAPGNWLFGKI